MSRRVWEERFRIRGYEAGPGGAASILSLCNFLQEAAGNHARDLGVGLGELQQANLTWVLSRWRIRIGRYPRWPEEIAVLTWPCGVERLFALRDFQVLDSSGAVIAAATSSWLMIDTRRRRPVRLPREVDDMGVRDRPRALPDGLGGELAGVAAADRERRFVARHSDMDVNRHVNNVSYVDWAIEAAPDDAGVLADLQISFEAEAVEGDEIASRTGSSKFQVSSSKLRVFEHELVRASDGETLALARTTWNL